MTELREMSVNYGKLHSLDGLVHYLLFLHMRPAIQLTITDVSLCQKRWDTPGAEGSKSEIGLV
jgi:hypothetical protein